MGNHLLLSTLPREASSQKQEHSWLLPAPYRGSTVSVLAVPQLHHSCPSEQSSTSETPQLQLHPQGQHSRGQAAAESSADGAGRNRATSGSWKGRTHRQPRLEGSGEAAGSQNTGEQGRRPLQPCTGGPCNKSRKSCSGCKVLSLEE